MLAWYMPFLYDAPVRLGMSLEICWLQECDLTKQKWVSWPLPVPKITGSHRALEGESVSAAECVPLLCENNIIGCWVLHRKGWLHFPCLRLENKIRWCMFCISRSLHVVFILTFLVGFIMSVQQMKGCDPQENRSHTHTVTSSGSLGYCASWPHFARTIETPLCVHARHLSPHSGPPSIPLLLSLLLSGLPRLIHPPLTALISTVPPVFVCVFVCRLNWFACARVISLRVSMSAPEIPAPPRWAWSPGRARRTRQPLSKQTAHRSHPPRSRSRSSTPTNSAWTRSGVRWRPSDRGVATQTSTAPGETQDSQKVNDANPVLKDERMDWESWDRSHHVCAVELQAICV